MDLFAGVGGFSLGFEQAGFDVVACVEYDPIHAATHAFNFPLTEVVCADVASVTSGDLVKAIAAGLETHGLDSKLEVDVIIGGPPCQGFSVGGKGKFDDDRNRLVFAFARVVGLIEPRYFVMENVPAIKTAIDAEAGGNSEGRDGSLLQSLIKEFDRLGYDICGKEILNARDYGVPQDRRRLILIGAKRGVTKPLLPGPRVRARPKRAGEPESPITRKNPSLPIGPSVWDAIGDLPDANGFEQLLTNDWVSLTDVDQLGDRSDYARDRREEGSSNLLGYPRKWDPDLLTSSLRTVHSLNTIKRFDETTPGQSEPVSRFYRLDPDGLANTLRAGTGYERGSFSAPRPIHPRYPRVITVREAARLQGFPDWFRFHSTKWHGFRQVGNALPPLFALALGENLIDALGVQPVAPARELELGDPEALCWGMKEAASKLGVSGGSQPCHQHRTRSRKSSKKDLNSRLAPVG